MSTTPDSKPPLVTPPPFWFERLGPNAVLFEQVDGGFLAVNPNRYDFATQYPLVPGHRACTLIESQDLRYVVYGTIEQVAAALAGLDPNEPAECRAKNCSYYVGYLAYGGPELVHEGYHAAEREYRRHADGCTYPWDRGPCPTCANFEPRLRA